MDIIEIQEEWKKDSVIDKTELGDSSLYTARLHQKYLDMYTNEQLTYIKLNKQYKKLYYMKYNFYVDGPNDDSNKLGWVMPPKGRISKQTKQELELILEADDDISNLFTKMEYIKLKMKYLEEVLKKIHGLSYNIRDAIDWTKFKLGNG